MERFEAVTGATLDSGWMELRQTDPDCNKTERSRPLKKGLKFPAANPMKGLDAVESPGEHRRKGLSG